MRIERRLEHLAMRTRAWPRWRHARLRVEKSGPGRRASVPAQT
jgi:hypothetical protein